MVSNNLSEEGLLKKIREWVKKIYFNANHLLRTEYWLLRLNPKADLVLRIAALTHDIERAFPQGRKPPSPEMTKADWGDSVYNLWHGKRSAKFIAGFLKKLKADQQLIKKVIPLVIYHELGGGNEADLVKDADSLSFLETNAPFFVSLVPTQMTKKEVKEKFDYMFNRISSKKAKKLAEPFYKKALNDLGRL